MSARDLSDSELLAIARRNASGPAPPPLPSPHQPHGAPYQVPANKLSDRHLLAYLANSNPDMPGVEDFGRSFVSHVEQGLTGMAGMPHTLSDAGNIATDWLTDRGREALGLPKLTPAQHQAIHQASALPQAISSLGLVNGMGPSTQGMDRKVQEVAGPYHSPQGPWGQFGASAGDTLPAALLPGGVGARAARWLIPAVGGAIGGQLTHGTALEPWARAGGEMAGGGLEALGEHGLNSPFRVFGAGAGNLSPNQIEAAVALRERAAGLGIKLTVPEAVQQVTGGGSGLGRVQRFVENARRTAPEMASYFSDRPGRVSQAVNDMADAVSPQSVGRAPGMIGLDAQRAGRGAQMAANSARGAASRAAGYAAAGPETVDQTALADILQNIDTQAAGDKTGLLGKRLGAFRANLMGADGKPISDIDNLSRVRNFWRDQIDLPPVGADPLSKEQAGVIGGHLDDLEALLKGNPNYAKGAAKYADVSRGLVDPLNAGPVGAIADSTDLGAQTGALYPRNPYLGAPQETADAIDALSRQDPDIAGALTRQHLGQRFAQSSRNLVGGQNQYGGALFVKDVAGNPVQADTLRSGLAAIDPSGELVNKWSDLADALAATGRREKPGSMTAFNTEDAKALGQAPMGVRAIGNLLDPLEWGQHLTNAFGKGAYDRNLDLLAEMLRDPDTAAVLRKGLKFSNPDPTAAARVLLPGAAQSQGAAP